MSPLLECVEQRRLVRIRRVNLAQLSDLGEIPIERRGRQIRLFAQAPKAELIPAFALARRKRFGPIARAVTEQQFGIACVAERERRLTEQGRRGSANAAQQFAVAVVAESAIDRQL